MRLEELTAYAEEKYHLREQHKWDDFSGFSVLSFSHSGSWVALLMRQKDPQTGKLTERCDLKCGEISLMDFDKPYLSLPFRMRGPKWIGITFDEHTEPQTVFKLFDRAVAYSGQYTYTVTLDPDPVPGTTVYRDTPLPFPERMPFETEDNIPEKIRQMQDLYEYKDGTFRERCSNFYRQGIFMQDYEDDAPWFGGFSHIFPTYHDMTVRQLRGYFSWRTRVRKGEYTYIPTAAAWIYIFELLNGIGVSSAEESLEKMKVFKSGFLDSGVGDREMEKKLRRLMYEFAVIHGFPPETVQAFADPEEQEKDSACLALRDPEAYTDEEVFAALCSFEKKKLTDSPVLQRDEARGKHLFAEVWRTAVRSSREKGQDIFIECIGTPGSYMWYPLSNAVIYRLANTDDSEDIEYVLNACRRYQRVHGVWKVECYENLYFNRNMLQSFCHETDLKLRRYLKTGRYLREKPEEEWAAAYAEEAIAADKLALIEAARPKITIDLAGLDRIREDAIKTRDSLLTEEEISEPETPEPAPDIRTAPSEGTQLPLDAFQVQILRELLSGNSTEKLLRENHQMPSIAADRINEALFDVFGDMILACDDDKLSIIEDYREDLSRLLVGNDQ